MIMITAENAATEQTTPGREQELPRERLLRSGAGSLTDGELVALLLRTGARGRPVLDMADDLLAGIGGVEGLATAEAGDLRKRGLGPAKVSALLAVGELACRMARREVAEREPLRHPAAVARYLGLRYRVRDQERMGALYLDSRQRLIGERELFRGTLDRAAVEPRQILREGLRQGAAGAILFHTHPSGDPSPSAEDLAFTKRLAEAGEIVGVRLVDHLVLGSPGRWVSLRQRGGW